MTLEEELKQKADTLLALREDLYEMHFHQVDRQWIIDAMIDFAEMNHFYFRKSEKPIIPRLEYLISYLDVKLDENAFVLSRDEDFTLVEKVMIEKKLDSVNYKILKNSIIINE